MSIKVDLTRERLPFLQVDAIAYGAKDTGEMGGGAAAAIVAAAGSKLIEETRRKLAATTRRVGVAVVTDSFKLRQSGIKWICHIISIITKTSQGDWCPYPEKLYDGVRAGLMLVLETGATSIALSALATGEGRVRPEDAARLMLTAIRDFQEIPANRRLKVILSLPTFDDYEAFESVYRRL
jgi:O-acetyl-ADP-ribose deacetylase (regulator of RNase III)